MPKRDPSVSTSTPTTTSTAAHHLPHEEPHELPHPDDELELALGNRAFMLGKCDGMAVIPKTAVSSAKSCVSMPGHFSEGGPGP